MKLENLIIGGSEKYLDIKYGDASKPKLVRKSEECLELELESINRSLREMNYYNCCDKEKDEECEHWHCIYSVLYLGTECRAVCGRRDK